MFGKIKTVIEKIKKLNSSINQYQKDTIIQSLPSLAYVNRAKVLIEKNKFDEAESVLLEALELPQKDALVYKYLGMVYEKTSRSEDAVKNYQISADLEPQDKFIWQRLGFSLISVEKYEQAEKSFENANKVASGNTDTFTGWGMSLMKQKRYDEARDKFMKAIKCFKYNYSALFLCAVMESKLEIYDKAEPKFIFLVRFHPDEANCYEYANLLFKKKNYDKAFELVKKALKYNSNLLPAYILAGKICAINFDEENCLKYFNKAKEKNLTSSDLYLDFGISLLRFGKFDEATEEFLKAQDIETAKDYLSLCKALKGDLKDVESISAEDNEVKKLTQAIGLYETDRPDEAIPYFKANEDDYLSCHYLAKCYIKKCNDTKVRETFEDILSKFPLYKPAYYDYINYLISNNDFESARRKIRKALKNEPDNIKLLNLMFYVNYNLVKANICEYNVKETLSIAEKIENINADMFEYPALKQELSNIFGDKN